MEDEWDDEGIENIEVPAVEMSSSICVLSIVANYVQSKFFFLYLCYIALNIKPGERQISTPYYLIYIYQYTLAVRHKLVKKHIQASIAGIS